MKELNQLAQAKFGRNFDQLSAFGQYEIRQALASAEGIRIYEKDQVIVAQAARIRELEAELKEAWDENEDLRIEQLTREEEYEDSIGRHTGIRKERVRGGSVRAPFGEEHHPPPGGSPGQVLDRPTD